MVELCILAGYLLVLALGGIISDYVFPHIRPLMGYINTLPMLDDETNILEGKHCEQTSHSKSCQERQTVA